jgi:hypothetical protein
MLIERPDSLSAIASGEHGYSLVEMLVAIVTGLVVSLALFAILDFSTRQSQRITDVAQATQLGRTAMTKIVDELHSACLAPGFTPIQEGSGPSELRFINTYGEEAVLSKAYKHKIVWNEKAETLTDYVYASNGGSDPNFTFSEAATPAGGVLLATHVKQSKSGEKSIPIFQYYGYVVKASESGAAGVSTLSTEPLATPLNEKAAPTAASVLISFNAAPVENTAALGKSGAAGININLSSQVTLAFSAPISDSESVDSPCH